MRSHFYRLGQAVTHHPDDLVPAQQEGNERPLRAWNFGVHKEVLKFFGPGHTQGLETISGPKGSEPQGKLEPLVVHQGSARVGSGNIFLAGGRAGGPGEGPTQESAGTGLLIRKDIFRPWGQGRGLGLPDDLVTLPYQPPIARQGDFPSRLWLLTQVQGRGHMPKSQTI